MGENGRGWRIGDIVEGEAPASPEADDLGRFGWYIVYTGGASEGRAKAAMELRGWKGRVYLPMMGRWKPAFRPVRQRGRLRAERKTRPSKVPMVRIDVPLYPGYLFVAARTAASEYWPLLVIPGIADVIRRAEGYPIRLPTDVIDAISAREAAPETVSANRPKLLMPKAGTVMRVVKGPFASFSGIVTGCDEDGQVHLDVAIFGRSTPVTMPLDDVEAIE